MKNRLGTMARLRWRAVDNKWLRRKIPWPLLEISWSLLREKQPLFLLWSLFFHVEVIIDDLGFCGADNSLQFRQLSLTDLLNRFKGI